MSEEVRSFFRFPLGFLWGAATSSHQVEGENRFNDWWAWEAQGKTKERSGRACDHYRLYKEDIRLAKELGLNSFRFSIEWSRIETRQGLWNREAVSHYKDVIEFCKALDIEPIVTINHFTLPLWFSELGGWRERTSLSLFERFVKKIVNHYGQSVRYWIVFNEPVVYIYKSYIEGTWPPGKSSYRDAIIVFRNLLRVSRSSYEIIHKIYAEKKWKRPEVGIAKHLLSIHPCSSKSYLDRLSVIVRDHLFNHLFIKLLVDKKALDFLGVDYYRRDFVRNKGTSLVGLLGDTCPAFHNHQTNQLNSLGWESYPKGLGEKLVRLSKFKLPILITENGFCSDNDKDRWDYILSHLKEVARALDKGVNVVGYIYWSLIDNFEWVDGFGPRFGLIGVDYLTQKRFIRESARRFQAVCRENRLSLKESEQCQ